MLKYKTNKAQKEITILFKNTVDIENAQQLYSHFNKAFTTSFTLVLHFEEIEFMHISIFQLINSAFLQASTSGKQILLKGHKSNGIKKNLENLGIIYKNGKASEYKRKHFWVTGGING